jgi:YHS domain-containing protein
MLRMMNKPSHSEPRQMVRDPVCKMLVNPRHAVGRSEYNGQTYFFCSAQCKQDFDRNPEQYTDG